MINAVVWLSKAEAVWVNADIWHNTKQNIFLLEEIISLKLWIGVLADTRGLIGINGLLQGDVWEGGGGTWEKKAWEISDSDHQVRSLRNDSALPWACSVLVGRQHCLCSSPAACGAEMTLTAWFPRVLQGSSNHNPENEWGQMDKPSTNMSTLNGQLFKWIYSYLQ